MTPYYISDLQKEIALLPLAEKKEIRFLIKVDENGAYRTLAFEFPCGKRAEERRDLYERYILAMMNNLLVSFGGSELVIFYDRDDNGIDRMVRKAISEFQAEAVRNNRKRYGVYLNYINRMNTFLKLGKFTFRTEDIKKWREPDPQKQYRLCTPGNERERSFLRRAATELKGKCFCSLDIGGTSIKGAVVDNGEILALKEYRWNPSLCRTADEMNGHILTMLRFLGGYTGLLKAGEPSGYYEPVFEKCTSHEEMNTAADHLEAEGFSATGRFDAIVIGFPDIVVHNKIAGGESFKQLGMKNNPEIDYEVEFFKTSDLDLLAAPFAKKGAPIIVLNDGNAASYLTSVEQAFAAESKIDANGMFANTVGTEMGTGFISTGGTIQQIPLEGFQHIIDLGNEKYQKYPASDIRSILSTNTGIPGVVQKYISQMGLFRMAVTLLYEEKNPVFRELCNRGIIEYDAEKDTMYTASVPVDKRNELTRFLISLLKEENAAVTAAFRTMGKAMGILIDQDRRIFPEITTTRLLSGGIIADDNAYQLMREGLSAYNPSYHLLRLDETAMLSPLMKKMTPEQRNFNVAIGSAYIGNKYLLEKS